MIADIVYSKLNPLDGLIQNFPDLFRMCTKINAQSVADYYYLNPKEQWAPDEFPNVAPPWPYFWVEWKTAHMMRSEHPHPTALKFAQRWEKDDKGIYTIYRAPEPRAVMVLAEQPSWVALIGAKWMYRLRFFHGDIPGALIFEAIFFVSAEGKLVLLHSSTEMHKIIADNLPEYANARDLRNVDPNPRKVLVPHSLSTNMSLLRNSYEGKTLEGKSPDDILFDTGQIEVLWLTLSFCHCKNVTMKSQHVPEALRRKRQKHGKLPMEGFRVIEIAPMRRVLQESAPEGESLQRRLHICRGHFKEFKEHKLFGKHEGIYWWGQQSRGQAELGKIKQVYRVKT